MPRNLSSAKMAAISSQPQCVKQLYMAVPLPVHIATMQMAIKSAIQEQ